MSDNPPRPAENSTLWSEMGGYSAARSDFSDEHDNFVEIEIGEMDFREDDADSEDELVDDDKQERKETRKILSGMKVKNVKKFLTLPISINVEGTHFSIRLNLKP